MLVPVMARIYGRRCTLTLELDGEPSPLPYAEETIRSARAGTRGADPCLGITAEGCFITRLDAGCAAPLLSLAVRPGRAFSLVQGQGRTCRRYGGLTLRKWELYAGDGGAFYFKGEVTGGSGSFVEDCPPGAATPWTARPTLRFRGRGLTEDGRRLPPVYRMRLRWRRGTDGAELYLHSALSDGFFPGMGCSDELLIPLGGGLCLAARRLGAVNDLRDVGCAGAVLARRRLRAGGLSLLGGGGDDVS